MVRHIMCDVMWTLSNFQGVRIGPADWWQNEEGDLNGLLRKSQEPYPLYFNPEGMEKGKP